MRVTRWVLAALVVLAACGDSDAGVDAAVDAGDAGLGVAPPAIPWFDEGTSPVTLTPCPEGWRTVDDLDPAECRPYPESGPATCDEGEAHFPGEAGCRPIGEACPSGDYSAALPTTGTIVYVRAGAASGGDGSMASPYAALSEVPWPSLGDGTTVALARGTYEGTLPLKAGVRVMGACVAETIVTGISAPVRSVISVTSSGAEAVVSNLTVRGAAQQGAYVDSGRSLRLDGVLFDELYLVGVAATGAGTSVTVMDFVVKDTIAGMAEALGVGLSIAGGAHLDAARIVISGSAETGIFADDAGTVVTLSDAAIVDATGLPNGTRGRAVNVRFGGHFEARRTWMANNLDIAMIVGVDGAEAVLEDVVIEGVRENARDGTSGRGLAAQDGAKVTATRVVVAEHDELGVFMSDPGTEVTLRHVVVRDGRGRDDGVYGRGIAMTDGPALDAENLAVLRNLETGVMVANNGARATLRDTLIADTGVEIASSSSGRGLIAQNGGILDVARVVVIRNHELGFFVAGDGAEATLEDVVIADTYARPDGRGGLGLITQALGHTTGARVQIRGAREHGVLAIGGAVELDDVSIHDVQEAECSASTCAELSFGYGAAAVGGTLDLNRFDIAQVELCGVFVAAGDETVSVDLTEGAVTQARIGACVQADGYDLTRLTNGVDFTDNETNLDATRLPVPEPAATATAL